MPKQPVFVGKSSERKVQNPFNYTHMEKVLDKKIRKLERSLSPADLFDSAFAGGIVGRNSHATALSPTHWKVRKYQKPNVGQMSPGASRLALNTKYDTETSLGATNRSGSYSQVDNVRGSLTAKKLL